MDNRAEVREFLMSRRAKVTPQEVGLPAAGARRVPGLRRSEAAELAGVSVVRAGGDDSDPDDDDERVYLGLSRSFDFLP